MRRVRETALCAVAAALVVAHGAAADVTPTPCVGAGLVAIVQPNATTPITLGPAVTAATTTGADAATFHDTQYAVDLTGAQAGGAGCVRTAAPGGTHVVSHRWSVLGAVSGDSLRADLVPASGDGSGWHLRTTITNLQVGARTVDVVTGATTPVSNWGTLTIGAQADLPRLQPLRYWAAAFEVKLTRPHAGLPAGTLVLIGYAAANQPPAKPPPPPPATTTAPVTTTASTTTVRAPTTTAPTTTAPTTTAPRSTPAPKKRVPKTTKKKKTRPRTPTVGMPLEGTPPLGGQYVFPLAALADWGDTYGAERSDVPGGWHHGDDLFAPLGTPVVAVADGTIFAVGWNHVGGWRLWLVDHDGNDFYYAHLSGYTRLARNNRAVHRGDVIGFVGNTGDAFTTLPHLHFEVHPTGLLYLGYDGAVDPTTYLRSWPLPHRVEILPPVELPGGAPLGFGSATDFRRLLAVHPRPAKKPSRPAPATPTTGPRGTRPRPTRLASAPSGSAGSGEGSALPIVAGILLLAVGLAAVVHAARDGRT